MSLSNIDWCFICCFMSIMSSSTCCLSLRPIAVKKDRPVKLTREAMG